jgi:hypothetical protein
VARRKGPRMQKEIERLRALGHGKRTVSRILGISRNTVRRYWPEGAAAEERVGPPPAYRAPWSEIVDWRAVEEAVSLGQALSDWWEERQAGDAVFAEIPYVSFWREYRRRYPKVDLVLHQNFPPGQRMEADFKGREPLLGYWDRATEKFVGLELFGAALCFSQLFYAEATESQQQMEWFRGVEGAFRYIGGVTETVVFDNAPVSVTKPDRYDPDVNPEFWKFSEHFGFAPLPARPRSPRDKATIEGLLNLFWRWVRPRLARQRFFSKAEVNAFLRDANDTFNLRFQKKYGASRKQRFDAAEKNVLRPLPETRFEAGEWRKAKPHPDCHLQAKKNFYSAPYRLRGVELDVRVSAAFVEIFHRMERVAIHRRVPHNQLGRYVTDPLHLPDKHRAYLEFTPQRALEDARRVGGETAVMVERLLTQARHPLLFLRRVQGILRLSSRHGRDKLEFAAATLNSIGVRFPRVDEVEAIAKAEPPKPQTPIRRLPNPNLRGQMSWSFSQETINDNPQPQRQ